MHPEGGAEPQRDIFYTPSSTLKELIRRVTSRLTDAVTFTTSLKQLNVDGGCLLPRARWTRPSFVLLHFISSYFSIFSVANVLWLLYPVIDVCDFFSELTSVSDCCSYSFVRGILIFNSKQLVQRSDLYVPIYLLAVNQTSFVIHLVRWHHVFPAVINEFNPSPVSRVSQTVLKKTNDK